MYAQGQKQYGQHVVLYVHPSDFGFIDRHFALQACWWFAGPKAEYAARSGGKRGSYHGDGDECRETKAANHGW